MRYFFVCAKHTAAARRDLIGVLLYYIFKLIQISVRNRTLSRPGINFNVHSAVNETPQNESGF